MHSTECGVVRRLYDNKFTALDNQLMTMIWESRTLLFELNLEHKIDWEKCFSSRYLLFRSQ